MQNKKAFESPFTKEEWNCKFYPPPPSVISQVMLMMEVTLENHVTDENIPSGPLVEF
jgi:hypothetical protein